MFPGTRLPISHRLSRLGRRHLPLPVGGLLLLLLAPAAQAGIIDLAWVAPATMEDGSTPLTDLSLYRVYVGTSGTSCPGPTFRQVASPTPAPAPGDAITTQVTGLTTGTTYVLQVTAVDANGNESVCSNQATGLAIADPLDTTAPTGTLWINNDAPSTRWTAATLSLTATDGVGVTAYYVSSNSTPPSATASGWVAVTPTTSYGNPSVPFTLSSGNGTKTVYAWYKDAAGNVSPTASDAIILDQTAPTVSLTAPTAGQTVSGSVTVSATASDASGVAGVQFKLDGANLGAEDTTAPFSISWSTPTAANGSHTLTAVARDVAGNATTSAGATVTVSNTLPATSLSDRLVAAYSFDEGSGTTVADASGNGRNGSVDGATWVPGKWGTALNFAALTQYVSLPTSINTGGQYTFSAWVRRADLGGTQHPILSRCGASWSTGCKHWYFSSSGQYRYGTYRNGDTRGSAVKDTAWHFVAVVQSGTHRLLYVDGVQVGSRARGTEADWDGSHPLQLGRLGATREFFGGVIDEVRFHSRVLSQAEIQQAMTIPVGGTR